MRQVKINIRDSLFGRVYVGLDQRRWTHFSEKFRKMFLMRLSRRGLLLKYVSEDDP